MPPTTIAKRLHTAARRAVLHADGWVNALTGLGYSARDKTLGAKFVSDDLSDADAQEIYRGDDMAARIVDKLPNEMTRQGFSVRLGAAGGQTDEQRSTLERSVKARLDELGAIKKCNQAMKHERSGGGGAILLGVDDVRDPAMLREPLNVDRVNRLAWLTVLRRRELVAVEWYTKPSEAKYGEPSIYRIQPDTTGSELGQVEVHESRLVLFRGIEVSREQVLRNNGWGDSVLVRCNRVISQFNQSWSGAAILLADFAQAVIKIKGLAELLAANECDAVTNRAAGVDLARSIARAVIIDSEEEYERKATPITGMPEMLQQFALRLSAAAEMPVSMLMGQAPAGLNATGDSDIRFFYDNVKSAQDDKLKPALERITELVLRSKLGPTAGAEPDTWEITFPSLWQPTEVQASEIRLKQAQTDEIYIRSGVVSPEEIATSRFAGPTYSTATSIDQSARKWIEEPQATPAASGGSTGEARTVPLTPSDLATILTVNQVLSHPALGYGPKRLPSGELDPDGNLTVAEYQAKHATPIAQASAAAQGETGPGAAPPATLPQRSDSRAVRQVRTLARQLGYLKA